ncbi:hypothetical protein, partial [Pseudomonas sp. 2822-15]|uniref:hypothetical protein n=1 Tax=Pseudomonas sp. 2822-15 TaxID=1712677 RepID=UPI0013043987
VQWRKAHLKSLLENPSPQDKERIQEASLHLFEAVKALEGLTDQLELNNALENARVKYQEAENMITRYDNANGDKDAEVYDNILT